MTLDGPRGPLAITRATVADVSVVRALRDELASWMVQRGVRQWTPGELPEDWIANVEYSV